MDSYTSPPRPGEPDIPAYRFVSKPDPNNHGSTTGCYGCAFRRMLEIRCSRIPCQRHPTMVAELLDPNQETNK